MFPKALSLSTQLFTTQSQLLMILIKKTLENILEKKKMLITSIFYFSTMFPTLSNQIPIFYLHLICHLQMLPCTTRLKFCSLVKSLPFPKQALVFTCLLCKSFEILWEMEKWLVTSHSSFSLSVFLSNLK